LQDQQYGAFPLSGQTTSQIRHLLGVGFALLSGRLFVEALGPNFSGDFGQLTRLTGLDLNGNRFQAILLPT
jgi:hypothetical protein